MTAIYIIPYDCNLPQSKLFASINNLVVFHFVEMFKKPRKFEIQMDEKRKFSFEYAGV